MIPTVKSSMAHLNLDSSWATTTCHSSFKDSLSKNIVENNPASLWVVPNIVVVDSDSNDSSSNIPRPPLLACPGFARSSFTRKHLDYSQVPTETKDAWEKLFKEGYLADLHIVTEEKAIIPAHSCILGTASPVLRSVLEQSEVKPGLRCIKIRGVPFAAVHAFIRFLYSSGYGQEEMKKFVLHLLVLSHTFAIPSLKKVCVDKLVQHFLTFENVIDVLQLARQCDAPRLSLFCVRFVVKNFKNVSRSEGWKVMKQANPMLEQELLESVVEADSRKQERLKKIEEKKIYLQLYDAMEALLHICRDGCSSIGPRDKMLKGNQAACGFSACKGLESLVRHFSGCKTRVPGGCIHCKRMWQLLELHSRMCNYPDSCKVPLCRHFKEKVQRQGKKDEAKWRLLVSKVKQMFVNEFHCGLDFSPGWKCLRTQARDGACLAYLLTLPAPSEKSLAISFRLRIPPVGATSSGITSDTAYQDPHLWKSIDMMWTMAVLNEPASFWKFCDTPN
ncbi:hypothetical protein ACLOJK_008911, partial [Asimina triloba]